MAYLRTRVQIAIRERHAARFYPRIEAQQRSIAPLRSEAASPPSVTAFMAKFMAASLALMAFPILVAVAPQKVTLPLGVVFATGIAASGITALAEKRRAP